MAEVKYVRVLAVMGVIGSQVGLEIYLALADNELDAGEVGRIVKRAIQGLRMAGVGQEDLDQVRFITDPIEFQSLEFKEGDMLIYSPAEVNSKMKVKLD